MNLLEIFPPTNAVESLSRYFIDIQEAGRWKYYTIEAILFYFSVFLTVFSLAKDKSNKINTAPGLFGRILLSDWIFTGFVIGFIMISRIPLAILGIQNADESLWIESAKTFSHDPRPWVSADTGTGGPLVPLLLLTLKWVGIAIDHGSLKFMSGAMMALSATALYLGFAKLMGKSMGRLVILPLVVAVSFMRNNDMVAYNSEHPAILLISFSFLLLIRVHVSGVGRFNLNIILLGVLLGFVPFAKLQAVPIAFCIGILSCLVVYRKSGLRPLLILVTNALMPAILILLALFLYGGLGEFWFSFVQNNFTYATQTDVEQDGLGRSMNLFFNMLSVPGELHFFLYYSFTIILFSIFFLLSFSKRMNREQLTKVFFVLTILSVTIYCIVTPGRPFTHYILLLFIPLTITTAILIHIVTQIVSDFQDASQLPNREFFTFSLAILFLISTSLYYFQVNFSYSPDYLNKANERYDGFCLQNDVTAVLNRYSSENERMAVWGWAPELFEGTNFLMGTRDCAASFQIEEGPHQGRLLARYVNDLEKNKPKIFIEAIGPNFFGFQDRAKSGFENFADLNAYIKSNYTFDGEVGGARIFIRNGKLNEKKSWISNEKFQPTTQEFHSSVQIFETNGTFLQVKGWTVLGSNTDQQQVKLALINKSDTLLVEAYQQANKSVVDFAPQNKGFLMCGFLSFLPLAEIPAGDFGVGLLVKNENQVGFKWLGKTINRDSLISKPQP